jgi:hypothetical protein
MEAATKRADFTPARQSAMTEGDRGKTQKSARLAKGRTGAGGAGYELEGLELIRK